MNIVLTGGTSGLGYRTAQVLGSEIKNKIILIGSNKHKGKNSVKALIKETSNKNIKNITGKYFYQSKIDQPSIFAQSQRDADLLWEKSISIVKNKGLTLV